MLCLLRLNIVLTQSTSLLGHLGPIGISKSKYLPRAPKVPLLRALWPLLNYIWGVLKGSWGVLVIVGVSWTLKDLALLLDTRALMGSGLR